MFTYDQISGLLHDLDVSLSENDMTLEIVILGGVVLQKYGSVRSTHDVDTLSMLNDKVKDLLADIGYGENEQWLNDDARTMFFFDESLPEGWLERAKNEEPIFVGESGALVAFPLARKDLMLTKMFALFTRRTAEIDKDVKDLRTLDVTYQEMIEAIPELHLMLSKHPSLKRSPEAIERYLAFLKR